MPWRFHPAVTRIQREMLRDLPLSSDELVEWICRISIIGSKNSDGGLRSLLMRPHSPDILNSKCGYGITPLSAAILRKTWGIARALVELGAVPDSWEESRAHDAWPTQDRLWIISVAHRPSLVERDRRRWPEIMRKYGLK